MNDQRHDRDQLPGAGVILALAMIPFALKILTFALLYGSFQWLAVGYAPQSLYKLGQLLVPGGWRR